MNRPPVQLTIPGTIKPWTRCQVCNRRLTNPESMARGVGPVCAGAPAKVKRIYQKELDL